MRVVILSNHYSGDVKKINLKHKTDAYYFVLEDKSFEPQWNEFKVYCKENFVIPHIVFITPLSKTIVGKHQVEEFLTAYIYMCFSDVELDGTYA